MRRKKIKFNCLKMILRVIKVAMFVAFLSRLSIFRFRDVSADSDVGIDLNESLEFPNLLIQQKEREGVSDGSFIKSLVNATLINTKISFFQVWENILS